MINRTKVCLTLVISLLLLLVLINTVSAKVEYSLQNPVNPQDSHYYSVIFDGEGDAVVIARLGFHNTKKTEIQKLSLEIPGTKSRVVNMVQEYFEDETYCQEYSTVNSTCLKYGIQKGYTPKYETIDYKRSLISKNNTLLELNLPHSIKSQESTTILLYYKSKDYTKKSDDIFYYDFKTIKNEFDIDLVQVSVDISSEKLYLKGVSSKINYNDPNTNYNKNVNTINILAKSSNTASDYREVHSNLDYIGQGSIIERANYLDPFETLSVTGQYAESWLALNSTKVIYVSLVSIVVLLVLVFGVVKLFKYTKKMIKSILTDAKSNKIQDLTKVILWGFLSAFLLTFIWSAYYVIPLVFRKLVLFNYYGGSYYPLLNMIPLIVTPLLGLLSLIIVFTPGIYFATKYDPMYCIWYAVSFIISSIVLIPTAVIVWLALTNYLSGYPYY